MIDLAAQFNERATARLFREAIRLKLTTAQSLLTVLQRHPNARGTAHLRDRARRYAGPPYDRTRSDAEALALEVLHDADAAPPDVNEPVAREEADLSFPKRRRIIEIDGPQFHLFPEEDARKQAVWRRAGYDVKRIPSDDIYDRPWRLIALATE